MSKVTFKINGKSYEADGRFSPDVSLAEFIRTVADLKGTKTMCQEGGCGACIVAVRAQTTPSQELKVFSVNSCLVSVLSCHGWEVTTVEGIGSRTAGYHEVQRRLASFNGTQCGYCTPGWVCSMYSLRESSKTLTMRQIENSFAGNMCRCTGYRPIADAFKTFATDVDETLKEKLKDIEDLDMFNPCGVICAKKCIHNVGQSSYEDENQRNNGKLNNSDEKFKDESHTTSKDKCFDSHILNDDTIEVNNMKEPTQQDQDDIEQNNWCIIENNPMIVVNCEACKWFKPYNLSDAFEAMGRGVDYKLIAGNTAQGVYHVRDYPPIVVDIAHVSELRGHYIDVNLVLGAGMTLSEMLELFLQLATQKEEFRYLQQFYDHMDLVAHVPVRNIGTIGGNLFMKHEHNDFPSDLFLLFETVGGMLTIGDTATKIKAVSLTDFLKVNMTRKIILNVMLPPLASTCLVKTYKIMPRSQNAHAVVNAGFLFSMKPNSNCIAEATVVYGNISPKFVHASKTEKVLEGKDLFTNETLQLALKTLKGEVNPEEAPPEPSAKYRKMLALALFYKAILSLCPNDRINPKYRSGGEVLKRATSKGIQVFDTDKNFWPLNKPVPKLEALVQCSGEATFANDLPSQTGEVYGAFVTADARPGSVIAGFDSSEAMKVPGVIAFYTAKDIPGDNSFAPKNVPMIQDTEEILCSGKVLFHGQPAAIIVADREKTANKAAQLVKVIYSSLCKVKPVLTLKDVLASPQKGRRMKKDKTLEPKNSGKDVKCKISGDLYFPTQYHYPMEPQTCVVKPTEDGYEVYSATQWMDLTNVAIAQCLKILVNKVNVIVRRVGGSYGAKITRSVQVACASALVSHLTGKTCRFLLPIETSMRIIGKRIPTYCNFELGTDEGGTIQYLKTKFYHNNGHSPNETLTAIVLQHIVNCYDYSRWAVDAFSIFTDLPSNTWCRAPASTEGVAMIEYMMEKIAFHTGQDPLHVRLRNMTKGNNPVIDIIHQIKRDSNYDARFEDIERFNKKNRWRKRSIKLMPMSYELSYVVPFNVLISVYYADGSVMLTHGGIEMGQGINTKVAQVCAYELGIPLEKVSVKPSSSFTSPNVMVTGGSVGSECVAFATVKACKILLERLKPIRQKLGRKATWPELLRAAFDEGIDLQVSSTFSNLDNVKGYEIYAAVVIEVEVDILTGNHDIRRVDLLEDVGKSLSPVIDVGQIEGAFVMGLGYWTSEQVQYDADSGRILTDRTWTYKPPGIKDIPADFRVYFRRNSRNPYGVLQSKATGEPALCLAVAVTHALREAVYKARRDAGYPDQWLDIKNPCTVENIFMAVDHKIEHFKLK